MLTLDLIQKLSGIRTWDDYAPIKGRSDVWSVYLQEIARRHGLLGELEWFGSGTHVTGAFGDVVVKLFLPFWRDFGVEVGVLERLEGGAAKVGGVGRLPVQTPTLLGEGQLVKGWSYALLTKLPGTLLSEARQSVDAQTRHTLLREAGAALFALHQTPNVETLGGLPVPEWSAYIQGQRQAAIERQRDWGLPRHLLDTLSGVLDALKPLHLGGFQRRLLHGDFTARQCLTDGQHLTGLIDFGDALLGHYEYDLAGAAAFMTHGQRDDLRALLTGYGFPTSALTPALGQRLLGWLLLHHHGDIAWLLRTHFHTNARALKSWAQVQAVLFPLG